MKRFGPFMRLPALLPVLALLCGCGADVDRDDPVRIEAVGETSAARLVAESISVGLTRRDAEGRIIPGLAQSWRVSDDGSFIVFRLRDAQFASGARVTAADVVQSLSRARRSGGLMADLLGGVTEIEAPLPDVIEIGLSTPQPEMLELLADPGLGIRRRGSTNMRAGPFVEVLLDGRKARSAGKVELRRNGSFFAADSVAIAGATIEPVSGAQALASFQRGTSDMVMGGRLESFTDARILARRATLLLEPAPAALLLLVNERRPPLDDPRVRRALTIAVERETLGQRLFGSADAAPIEGLSPPNFGAPARPGWTGVDIGKRREEARRLLAEAGVPVPFALPVMVSTAQEEQELIGLVADDLARVGVRLTLERRTPAGHAAALQRGAFTLALVSRETPIASPLPFLLPFRCGANQHGVCLPEADRLLADSWKARTAADRMRAYAAAERLWAEDGAAIGLVQPLSWALVSPRVRGYEPNATGAHPLAHLSLIPASRFFGGSN